MGYCGGKFFFSPLACVIEIGLLADYGVLWREKKIIFFSLHSPVFITILAFFWADYGVLWRRKNENFSFSTRLCYNNNISFGRLWGIVEEKKVFFLSPLACVIKIGLLADYYGVLWRRRKFFFSLHSPVFYNNLGFWLTKRACGGKFRPLV